MYLGARIMLPGHLLASKGDRVAMHSSVEARYPFLDEELLAYTSTLHPRWKLRGVLQDKFVERQVARRWLPPEVAGRAKKMFRAPMDAWIAESTTHPESARWINQVLSRESLEKTGLFDPQAVANAMTRLPKMRGVGRTGIEMGLTAVTATQIWHHLFISGGLCELPTTDSVRPTLLG
jgi:asparagine synthase (glutamine-hydrolysing)